ncbi:MAG: MFS transporter [Treponema sp.]|nr:MFS transporter [Treponema sp.]
MAPLTPASLSRGRRSFFTFNGLNSISFILLSGSFVTLYALSLGASNALVGALNAFAYGTFFFLPLGKSLVRRRSIVSVFGWAWFYRYIAMLPALAAPIFAATGRPLGAFACLVVAVAVFNILRGIGMIGNNPVLANLASGGPGGKRVDKGAFLVNVQIVGSVASLGTNLAIALVIGNKAGPWVFSASMAVGIVIGLAGSLVLIRDMPEPEGYRPESSASFVAVAREAFAKRPFRIFIEVLVLLSFVAGMARTFMPVYAKDVFAQGDNAIMVYSLVGSLGSIVMGLLTRLLVDRLGARPLYVIFVAAAALSLAPLALAPGPVGFLSGPLEAAAFLVFANFVSAFGLTGEENAGQTYFFALVEPERTLDLGIVYFLMYGLGGAVGSTAGGFILDFLGARGLSASTSYQLFFGSLVVILAYVLIRLNALVRLGSASVRESLFVMLSLRDLRAFDLLARLDRSADPAEEIALIHDIGAAAKGRSSARAQSALLEYLSSPRFEVRLEALIALESMPQLDDAAVKALIEEVERQPYTTAYVAARILGKAGRRFRESVLPCLRAAAEAEDYMLVSSAMTALARLDDGESLPLIERILARTGIGRVRIAAAYAIELLRSRASVPILVSCLRREGGPPFVSDELLLASASVLGLMPRFYALYTAFLDDEETGTALLTDAAAERFGPDAEPAKAEAFARTFRAALDAILAEPPDGRPMHSLILGDWEGASAADLVLAEAALEPELAYRGFRFFIAAYAALRS